MKTWLKIVIPIVVILLVIQIPAFRPAKNMSKANPVNDIMSKYPVPMDDYMVIYASCYDCHSNYTHYYPWYYKIQPVSWWMAHHINKGKRHLNFSEFATYSPKKAAHKFKEIAEQMDKKKMPLKSYLWMHDSARMTDAEYKEIADWAKKSRAKILAQLDSAQAVQ